MSGERGGLMAYFPPTSLSDEPPEMSEPLSVGAGSGPEEQETTVIENVPTSPSPVNDAAVGFGATRTDWMTFTFGLGLDEDLLPVVSDPRAVIAPESTLTTIGKVPSEYNGRGQVRGITGWSDKRATPREITAWMAQPDYGICIQTRVVRGLDVDITEPGLAGRVRARIEQKLGTGLPVRVRANSSKFLVMIETPGVGKKLEIKVGGGQKIELLADGQQFIAAGTHPSGARYEWEGGPPAVVPAVALDALIGLWQELHAEFAIDKQAAPRSPGAAPDDDCDISGRSYKIATATQHEVHDVRFALEVFTPEMADDYDTWVKEAGMGLKSLAQAGFEDEACELFHSLSSKTERYAYDQTQAKWDGFAPTSKTWASILDLADKADQKAGVHGTPDSWRARANVAWAAAVTSSTRIDRTDAGNVNVLASIVGGNLRYCPDRRTWLWWDGSGWHADQYGSRAQDVALQVAEHYHREAARIRREAPLDSLDAKERKNIEKAIDSMEKWAAHCRNKRSLDSMLGLAKADPRFTLPVAQLDVDPWLFGVANGVVDLRTGKLRQAAREDYVTKRSPVAYVPGARAPRWVQFIAEITGRPGVGGAVVPRPALASYLQRRQGYCLTGSTAEHKMFVDFGAGSNGKSVVLDTLQRLMGDYCQTIPPEALMATRHDGDAERPSSTAAMLAGARLAISSESRDGANLDVALVKRHTGGGYLTARFMRENTFRFEITHKLVLMTNHRPALDHMDEAMRGRLHLMPFDMRWNRPGHPERDPSLPDGDKDLLDKLRSEDEGILAWLVAGAVAYDADGLEPPQEVVNMTREFFLDQDPLGRWLATCTKCDAKQGTSASDLWDAFSAWQDAQGEQGGPTNQMAFSLALKARGVPKHESKKANLWGLRVEA